MGRSASHVVGIDLGGTKIRIALVTRLGELTDAMTWPTHAEGGPDAVLGHIRDGVEELLKRTGLGREGLSGAGLGAPGPLDVNRGTVSVLPNLPGWQHFPLRERLSRALGMPVALGNDANVAALAEHRYGAGRGARDMVYVSLGTGVGGGIIVNNQLCVGVSGAAGEIGHIVMNPEGPLCTCGLQGCLEAYCSGRGLERLAAQAASSAGQSTMTALAAQEGGAITTRIIERAARDGDALALELLAQAAEYLGRGLVSLIHIFNPDLVVFGGGLVALSDLMIEPAIALAKEQVFEQHRQGLRFAYAGLGEDAGVLGAAALAMDTF